MNDKVQDVSGDYLLRPARHLDLTKTGLWSYAGKVKQDGTETAPGDSASPVIPMGSLWKRYLQQAGRRQ